MKWASARCKLDSKSLKSAIFYRFTNQKGQASQSHKVIRRIAGNCSKILFNLCFKGSRRKKKKKTKRYRTILSFAFLLAWENPISKLKIPISFCNCLHTEAVLSAKTSLKKKKTEGGKEREGSCMQKWQENREDVWWIWLRPCSKPGTKQNTKTSCPRLMKWGVAHLSFALLTKLFQLWTARADYQLNN